MLQCEQPEIGSTCFGLLVFQGFSQCSFSIVLVDLSMDGLEEDGNGRVLDTGLRGDPPALRVLDALLEANEFILWRGRGRKLGLRGSSECFQGISQSYKVIGQDRTPCSMFLWALYSVRMLYHRVSPFGWGRRFGLLNSWIL